MPSKRQYSSTSSEEGNEEHALFGKRVEKVEIEKSKRQLFEGEHQHAQVELLLLDVPKVLLDRPHRQSEMTVTKIRLSTLISYLMKIPQIER